MLRPGTVIVIADPYLTPPGRQKWQICVCPRRRLFLRINSSPRWAPHYRLLRTENPWLRRDSFVELRQLLTFERPLIDKAAANPSNFRGALSPSVRRALVAAAQVARTLSPEDKDIIAAMLSGTDDGS